MDDDEQLGMIGDRIEMRGFLCEAVGFSIALGEEHLFLQEVVNTWNNYVAIEQLSNVQKLTPEKLEKQVKALNWDPDNEDLGAKDVLDEVDK